MNPTTKAVAASVLLAGLALGGVGIAAATGPATPSTTGTTAANPEEQAEAPGQEDDEATESESGNEEQDPSYTGSIIAPEGGDTENSDTEASEAEEANSLQSLATTTPEQAAAAALAVVPGMAGEVELDNENGFVVYSVEVTGADGTIIDVKVDAGNSTVLAQDTDDDTEADD